MAVLTDTDRVSVWKDFMSRLSSERQSLAGVSKSDLRAAVDAADQWVSDNQAAYNSALPVDFRTNASAGQKALLLAYVVLKRYLKGV